MTSDLVAGYLARLGLTPGSDTPADLPLLRDLVDRHLARIPFENASVLRGEPIVFEPQALVARLVGSRRGGFCYELNGAFATLLRELGFEVDLLAARFHGDEGLEPRFGHLALRVTLEGEPWLVDVGGGYSFRQPLQIALDDEQDDPAGRFRVVIAANAEPADGDALDVEWRHPDGTYRPHYRFDPTARRLDEFTAACDWTRTSPESPFTAGWRCAVTTSGGWATLVGRHFRLTGDTVGSEDRELADDDEVTAVLDRWFGVAPI